MGDTSESRGEDESSDNREYERAKQIYESRVYGNMSER